MKVNRAFSLLLGPVPGFFPLLAGDKNSLPFKGKIDFFQERKLSFFLLIPGNLSCFFFFDR